MDFTLAHTLVWLSFALMTAWGCTLLLVAGHDEARGRLHRAARRARTGGLVSAIGTLGQVVVGIAALVSITAGANALVPALLVTTSLLFGFGAGSAGLLAGLSGKPRPSGGAAAVLLVLAVASWIAGTWPR